MKALADVDSDALYYTILGVQSAIIGLMLASSGVLNVFAPEDVRETEQRAELDNFSDYSYQNYPTFKRLGNSSELEYVLRPESAAVLDGSSRTPLYILKTNSKGLREESFQVQKPEGTHRMLFLGDSITYGWGVNRSDRYSDILEKKLSDSEQNYQTINAGVPAYGMKDFYHFYSERGEKYDPDTVIVSFHSKDVISAGKADEFHSRAVEEVGSESNRQRKINERVAELKTSYLESQEPGDSQIGIYMEKIVELAEENNTDVVFYVIRPMSQEWTEYVVDKAESLNSNLVQSPEEIESFPPEDKYAVSENDPHYNSLGNRILADHLHRELEKENSIS